MKTRIKIKNLGLGLAAVFLMLFTVSGYSQACPGNQLTLSIKNVVQTPTTLEYDIFVMNTSPVSNSKKLAALAGNVRFPAGMITTGTLTVVTQPSATGNFTGIANLAPTLTVATQQARWTNTPPAGEATSVALPMNTDLKFARFRITNTGTPWAIDYSSQLFFSTGGTGITLNIATTYCNGNPNSTPISLATSTLVLVNAQAAAVCFTSGSAATTAPTCFGRTDGSAIITMSPTPTSNAVTYVLDGNAGSATLSAGAFSLSGLAAGPHTLSVLGSGTCTTAVQVPFTIADGFQPAAPTLLCYQSSTFNSTTCAWDVTGTQPAPPTVACYETATFNNTTCSYDVTGSQPAPPTLLCYQTLGSFNNTTCAWEVSGSQPAAPTVACYETATFNNTTCSYDVTGTQPAAPTVACYETATFNAVTCSYDVTGTQPAQPTLLCYQTATFNNGTCTWDVTGTQPTAGSVTTTAVGSYTWPLPFGTGLSYTTSGVYTNTVGCNVATLNLTIIPTGTTVNTFNIGTSCGSTISSLSVTIIAAPVPGATTYTFRITNTATSASFVVNRPVNSFALSNYAGILLGTQYQIEVSVNGGANYGPACIVNTPAPIATIGTQCSSTLTSRNQWVYGTYYSSVTGYRFRITNPATSVSQVYTPLGAQNRFNFTQLPSAFVSYGTTYSVEVALRNTDGTYLSYGPACDITTPAFPTSEIVLSQCDTVATSNNQTFSAVIVSGATGYRFQLVNSSLGYSSSIDRPIANYKLNMFSGLVSGTTYTVRVAVRIGGVWGPLTGKPCTITTPGIAPDATREITASDFVVVAYPNPYAENFMLNVTTSAESTIQVRVYDMLGKQVENRNVDASEIANLQVGNSYPSGVYNVIVSQGENSQTLRVIKR